jgi:MFS family permease
VFGYAGGVVTGGRLGDLFGYRRMFIAGVTGFTLASGLCAAAQTPTELVAARFAQGLTAAAMVPQVLALITSTYAGTERARALTWFAALAIVIFFALPTAWGILTSSIRALHSTGQWLDTSTAWAHFPNATMTGTTWAQVATAAAVWVVLPTAAGFTRVLRSVIS